MYKVPGEANIVDNHITTEFDKLSDVLSQIILIGARVNAIAQRSLDLTWLTV